jgi:fibronectin-binding autotransporter adhesin
VNVGGSGAVTFGGDLSTNSHAVNVTNSAATTFSGSVNAGTAAVTVGGSGTTNFSGSQVNASALSVTGSGNVNASSTVSVGSSGAVTLSGAGTTTLSGAQLTAGAITVSGGGTQNFNTQIGATSFVRSGTGTTTFGGTGNNYFNTVEVDGGTLLLNKSSGTAISGGTVTVIGGTLSFGASNQLASWTNVTLGASSTVLLNNTSQTLSSLDVTGNSLIDFGSGGSILSVSSLVLASSAYLSVINWAGTVDSFFSQVNPGTSNLSHISVNGSSGTTWDPYTHVISPASPVPEPSTYGAMLMSGVFGMLAWRKFRAKRRLQSK